MFGGLLEKSFICFVVKGLSLGHDAFSFKCRWNNFGPVKAAHLDSILVYDFIVFVFRIKFH